MSDRGSSGSIAVARTTTAVPAVAIRSMRIA